jgi:DNA polymerase I-like protein with 3'-5' exonuclease and polymerase domains
MLGHFAEGAIKAIYDSNPSADIHQVAADIITDSTGLHLTRKHTKIVAFSILYGAGVGTMADRMKVSMKEAGLIKKTYLNTLTGVKAFMDDVESRAAAKTEVRSWGGRLLRAPKPEVQANGRVWNKDYVLLNYIIQGSSADQTKQAIINYERTRQWGRFLATVHDEICISVAPEHLEEEVAVLKAAMEAGEFDIPMRATVDIGPNWATMEEYK